jgi:hypothetical protein
MNEWEESEQEQDPEPTKHADAQRITEDEAKTVPTSEKDQPGDRSTDSAPEAD